MLQCVVAGLVGLSVCKSVHLIFLYSTCSAFMFCFGFTQHYLTSLTWNHRRLKTQSLTSSPWSNLKSELKPAPLGQLLSVNLTWQFSGSGWMLEGLWLMSWFHPVTKWHQLLCLCAMDRTACWHFLLGHTNGTGPSLTLWVTPVLGRNVCWGKDASFRVHVQSRLFSC